MLLWRRTDSQLSKHATPMPVGSARVLLLAAHRICAVTMSYPPLETNGHDQRQ